MWNNGNQGYGNQGYGNQGYGNQDYGNEGYGNQGYFPTPGGPPPPPSGFNFPSPDPYGGGPPPMPPRPMDSSPGQMPSPGQWGSPPVPSPYGDSPSPGNRGFGSSGSGGFAGGLLNSAVSKAASKVGVNFTPPGFSPPAGPPPGSGYQSPSGPPPGYGRDNGSGPSPNSVYNNFNSPSSNTGRPQEYRQPSFPFQPPGEYHMPPSQAQYYGPQMSTPGGGQQQPSFMYSQCTGKKKALIIGINYIGTDQELGGCINDARNMKNFIIRNYGYKDENVVMLTDDAQNPVQRPTRSNIIRAMEWLVRYAESNDSLFFHYSGHGGLTKDTDGDEEDGWDEVIYPVDHHETDHIVDDEMHEIMVRPLPAGCRLTAIFDSCHSGSALDLPYVYSTEGKIKEPNLYAEAGSSLLGAAKSYANKDYGGVLKGITGLAKVVSGSQGRAEKRTRQTRSSAADVISWSGCKDSQTSADTQVAGQGTGAMSWAFTESLTENKQQSYQQLLITIRSKLKAKYSQKPQLSSSHPMDTNILFIL